MFNMEGENCNVLYILYPLCTPIFIVYTIQNHDILGVTIYSVYFEMKPSHKTYT